MGLADIGSRVLIEYRGDTSDLKSKLRELQGEEKKLAQSQLEHAEKRNKGLEQWSDKLGKAGLALDGIERISQLAGNAIGKTAKSMLEATANGATLGATFAGPVGAAIGGAIGGLGALIKSTDQQSEASKRAADAARKHAAALQLVADGETAVRGARRGTREAEELAYEEFSEAQRKNVRIRSEASAADVERTRRVYREAQLEREALNRLDGTIWLEQQKREQDRINAIKDLEAARRSGTLSEEEATRRLKELNKVELDSTDIVGRMRQKHEETAEAVRKLNAALMAGTITGKEYEEALRAADENYRKRDDERKKREEDAIRRAKELAAERAKLASKVAKDLTDDLVKQLEGEGPSSVLSGGYADVINQDKLSANLDFTGALKAQQSAYGSSGFVDEVAKYSNALTGFADAASAAYETIASGSGSVTAALRSMAQQQLLGLGKVEVVEAIRQLALGFGSLANPLMAGEAALHFKSAAVHGAAAAAAGLGVAVLGAAGGGGGGGAGALPGGASAYGGSSRPQHTSTTTIYIVQGDSHSDDSPRMRQRNAEKTVELGLARSQSVTGAF